MEKKKKTNNPTAKAEEVKQEQTINYEEEYNKLKTQFDELTNSFNELNKKIEEANKEKEELVNKVKLAQAESVNYRRRKDEETESMLKFANQGIITELIPIVDNFERGLAAVPEAEKDGAFADGMNKIYKQLVTELENLGVTPIEAVGKEFDPNFHNAVMQVESEEYGSGIVAQELQKGYMFHDTVLRHSMVGVTP